MISILDMHFKIINSNFHPLIRANELIYPGLSTWCRCIIVCGVVLLPRSRPASLSPAGRHAVASPMIHTAKTARPADAHVKSNRTLPSTQNYAWEFVRPSVPQQWSETTKIIWVKLTHREVSANQWDSPGANYMDSLEIITRRVRHHCLFKLSNYNIRCKKWILI